MSKSIFVKPFVVTDQNASEMVQVFGTELQVCENLAKMGYRSSLGQNIQQRIEYLEKRIEAFKEMARIEAPRKRGKH